MIYFVGGCFGVFYFATAILFKSQANLSSSYWPTMAVLLVCMMGDLCRLQGTGCRSAAMEAPLASSGSARCKAVLGWLWDKPVGGGHCTDMATL